MTNYMAVYEGCCFYEIVILSYYLRCTGNSLFWCSPDGKDITCMEGFTVRCSGSFADIVPEQAESITVTGGEIARIAGSEILRERLIQARQQGMLIGGICAGVDLLDSFGITDGLHTIHTDDLDVAADGRVVTARANAYVDFAVEMGKELKLFADERDLTETIDFWKYHKRCD